MNKINFNTVALEVTIEEEKPEEINELNVTQVREVMSLFLKKLASYDDDQVLELVSRYKKATETHKII